jgi:hypothetical protein
MALFRVEGFPYRLSLSCHFSRPALAPELMSGATS